VSEVLKYLFPPQFLEKIGFPIFVEREPWRVQGHRRQPVEARSVLHPGRLRRLHPGPGESQQDLQGSFLEQFVSFNSCS
jgi:hypothetical protein